MNEVEIVEVMEETIERICSDQTTATVEENISRMDAYSEGALAFTKGVVMKDNPHKETPTLATEWRKGWLESRECEENPKNHHSIWESIQNDFDSESELESE